jgi:hypothetical protein
MLLDSADWDVECVINKISQVDSFYLFIACLLVVLTGCFTRADSELDLSAEQRVSFIELANPASFSRYDNKLVRFITRFTGISSRWDNREIEQYMYTHYLASLESDNGKYKLEKVIMSVDEKVPLLKPGDLIEVVGLPHVVTQSYSCMLVENVTKLQMPGSSFTSQYQFKSGNHK